MVADREGHAAHAEGLHEHPELGLLGVQQFVGGRTTLLVQYWRSFEDLDRFAANRDQTHLPAWRAFNRRVGTSGDVGIFHETFVVPASGIESLYNNMPLFGLAKATGRVEVARQGPGRRLPDGTGGDRRAGRAGARLTDAAIGVDHLVAEVALEHLARGVARQRLVAEEDMGRAP